MKARLTTTEQLHEMGYRWSNKSFGWVKVSAEFIRLERETIDNYMVQFEDYKLNLWLWDKQNPKPVPDDVGILSLEEVLECFKDRPKRPDFEFNLDPADYMEETA